MMRGSIQVHPAPPELFFKQREWSRWDHLVAYTNPPFTGSRTAGQPTDKRYGMTFWLDTNTGANLVWEAVRQFGIIPIATSLPGAANSFGAPFWWSMRFNRSNPFGGDTGEKFQGISWGDPFGVNTPWQTNYVTSQCQSAVHLCFNYTNNQWEVLVYAQDGNPPDRYACDVQPPFGVDVDFPEVALSWAPGFGGADSVLTAYINRKVVKQLVGNRLNTLIGPSTLGGPGIFWTNGATAGSKASEAGYYEGHIWNPLPVP
jgi:hypothetical protein